MCIRLQAMTTRALIFQHESVIAPQRVCAEGFVRNGSADAHILMAQSVAGTVGGRAGLEWGEWVWLLKADLYGAFGSIRYPDLWMVLRKRVWALSSHAFMRAVTGHGVAPAWMAVPDTGVPIHARRARRPCTV